MRAAILLLFSPFLAEAQTAALEGVAVNALTGEPLPGVHLRLVIGMFENGTGAAYGAISKSDGRFSISGLRPGVYMFFPDRTGFVYAQKPSGSLPFASLTFKSGEHVTDFQLKMTPC